MALTSVFIHTRLEEDLSNDMPTPDYSKDERTDRSKPVKTLIARIKDVGDLGKPEKEVKHNVVCFLFFLAGNGIVGSFIVGLLLGSDWWFV